jgi:hypothetical protein
MQCRSKLDFQTLDKQAVNEPESKSRNGPGWRLVWTVLLLGSVIGVALALWPESLASRKGTEADAQQARKKILLLEKGLSPASQVFTEREINAYLALMLRHVNPLQIRDGWTILMQAADVTFRPNAITLSTAYVCGPIAVGSITLGPWNMTSQIIAVPERGPLGYQWTIKGGRIGHLPLPGPMSAPATYMVSPLLASSMRERALLKALTRVELDEGQIVVAAKKGPG